LNKRRSSEERLSRDERVSAPAARHARSAGLNKRRSSEERLSRDERVSAPAARHARSAGLIRKGVRSGEDR
jgi:hypothetical protein